MRKEAFLMKILRNILLFVLLVPFASLSQSDGTNSNEYDLKALFIFNFIKYVDWPQANGNNFKIVVLGQSDIKEPLQKIAEQKKQNNQKIEVKAMEDLDEINCQVLFIPRAMSDRLAECISKFSGKGVLIVTEGKNLASKGSSINFVMLDNKMRFEINPSAVKSSGLKVSGQLLDLAIVVK
jgi:hypothetical protein